MNNRWKTRLTALLVALPLVFALLFFGYLQPRFDEVIYTDHIKGEGTCSAYLGSASQPFAYLYKADAYFDSELKTLCMQDLRYDVNAVTLYLYGVKEADILAYDIEAFSWTVLHHNNEGDHVALRPEVKEAMESAEEMIGHIVNEHPENVFAVEFVKSSGIPAWVWVTYFAFLLLLAVLLALGLASLFEREPGCRLPLLGAGALLAAMIMGCYFCSSLPYMDYKYFLLNWLLLAASLLIGALSLPQIGFAAVSLFTMIWYEAYPVLSSQGVLSVKDGLLYDSVAELLDDPLIQKYQYIQYANLFDELDPAWFEVGD